MNSLRIWGVGEFCLLTRLKMSCSEGTASSARTTCQNISDAWPQRREISFGLEVALDKRNVSSWKHSLDPFCCSQLLALLLCYFKGRRILLLENH